MVELSRIVMPLLEENQIRNDVIGGKDGYLFLYGGNAEQFAYLSRSKPVERESVVNFDTNTLRRMDFCQGIGADYLNVVMPSKPVCCEDKLPSAYVGRCTSIYEYYFRNEVTSISASATLYPVTVLRGSQNFKQLDTHLNDAGNLKAANAILSVFGFDLYPSRPLRNQPVPGDLAVMLDRADARSDEPTFDKAMAYLQDYDNKLLLPEGTNTGHLRVIVNTKLPTERRLLVCGDSFSVGLLPVFARYFHMVFYVRGPLFPYHAARKYAPTHVISASAERYIAKGIDDRGLPGPASEYNQSKWYKAGSSVGQMLDILLGDDNVDKSDKEVLSMSQVNSQSVASNNLPGIKIHKTLIVHKPNRFAEIRDKATTVVCGSQRGNTSTVAYCLYNMGFFLGERIGSMNYEDVDILRIMPDPSQKSRFNQAEFARFVNSRNDKYERWGFKIPHASGYVQELTEALRNVVFVVCFRNPVGIIRSIDNWEAHKFPLENMIRIAARPLDAAIEINKTNAPAIFIDTDEIIRRPEVFVRELSEVFQLDFDPAVASSLASSGYKPSSPRIGVTFVPQ